MDSVITETGHELVVELSRMEQNVERVLAREPIRKSDLMLLRDEVWLKGMEVGVLGPDLGRITMHTVPGDRNRTTGRLESCIVELREGSGSYRSRYGVASFFDVAERAAVPLVKQGVLEQSECFSYYLNTVSPEHRPPATKSRASTNGMTVTRKGEPLLLERASLESHMEASELLPDAASAIEEADHGNLPVFTTREVWEDGRESARRGKDRESAGVFTGRLFRDEISQSLFLRIESCIPAEQAEEEAYRVTLTGESWARVHEQLNMRRRRLKRPNERIVGTTHGHNFLPDADSQGNRSCSECATRAYCSRTTAAASGADLSWHKIVFRGAPWAVLLVWGFNARGDEDWRLYGLKNGTLSRRSIRLLHSDFP